MPDYNLPVSGKKLFEALDDEPLIVMAANIRVQPTARGIMEAAKEMDAAVMFEIAKSEVGYTGQSPSEFMRNIVKIAREVDFDTPYIVHGDHITIAQNTPDAINAAEDLIKAEIGAGFTSYAIDASHNFDMDAETEIEQLADNIEITRKLAKLIPGTASLEVEVGEVGKIDPATGKQQLTTAAEATTYISALKEDGIHPHLLATNNGTIHGNVYDKEGNVVPLVGIDVDRTAEVASAIKPLGVKIAQHGITGTPMKFMPMLIKAGIIKGNVGTNWQNIALENMPSDIVSRMEKWTLESEFAEKARAKKPGISEGELLGKNIKQSIKYFKDEIAEIPEEQLAPLHAAVKKSATEFFTAFNAKGSASKVRDLIG